MKKANLNFLVFLSVLILAFACEKDNITETETIQPEDELLKSLAGDVSIEDVPDIVVDDTILRDHASVSQYREYLLTYTYDRSNRLEYISYIRRNSITPVTNTERFPGYVSMRDKFNYSNDGRLIELVRYRILEKPQICNLELTKTFKYNSLGQLVQIITRKPNISYKWDKLEFLYYDNRGNMVRKLVRVANLPALCYFYSYDRADRLVKIAGYTTVINRLHFICDLFYDQYNNIQRKDFYFPLAEASNVQDAVKKWSVNYRYDSCNNPFRDLKLPVSSLFEWMDVISPSNITAISFDNGSVDRSVFYAYRYNNLKYPVLRCRVSLTSAGE